VTDVDAIVVGAGHNGLVTAAYLAKAGMSTLLVEARAAVGGTAASERFADATVNICNCDHLTFRTTPVMSELGLAEHGLRYLDLEPSQLNIAWDGSAPWPIFHDIDRTLDALQALHPGEVEGYRRYLKAAIPAVKLLFDAANDPPSLSGLARKALEHRMRGVATMLRWSRMSAADIMRSFFSTEALRSPGLLVGPMVWGISPEFAGSGLGALTYALRHVATVGRPVGGSGAVPESILSVFLSHGGQLRLSSAVSTITCDNTGVTGVTLSDGSHIRSSVVVSACDPQRTFVEWLTGAPTQADDLIARWRAMPHSQGYESKIDAVATSVPQYRNLDARVFDSLGIDPAACTAAIAPSLAEMHRGYELMGRGEILQRPGLLVNVPSLLDPTMAPPGKHVFSLEAIYTPYDFTGGWVSRDEPARWLRQYSTVVHEGFTESITEWRAMTPATYEREFHLPAGHATSFAGGPLSAIRNKNPELTRYETPVTGLYLTGAATFPGAGVWGASGRNAAMVVLQHH